MDEADLQRVEVIPGAADETANETRETATLRAARSA
jgi:hypothetical protein